MLKRSPGDKLATSTLPQADFTFLRYFLIIYEGHVKLDSSQHHDDHILSLSPGIVLICLTPIALVALIANAVPTWRRAWQYGDSDSTRRVSPRNIVLWRFMVSPETRNCRHPVRRPALTKGDRPWTQVTSQDHLPVPYCMRKQIWTQFRLN